MSQNSCPCHTQSVIYLLLLTDDGPAVQNVNAATAREDINGNDADGYDGAPAPDYDAPPPSDYPAVQAAPLGGQSVRQELWPIILAALGGATAVSRPLFHERLMRACAFIYALGCPFWA